MAEQEVIHSVDICLQRPAHSRAEDSRFAGERRAFWAIHAELLRAYEGKYVAILNGKVVDCDEDKRALAKRLYRQYGYQPMYVQFVTAASLPIYHLSSPRPTIHS
jgi:Family of unknown function (DUF5678)